MIEDLAQMPLGRIESRDDKDKKFPLRADLPRKLVYRKNPWLLGPPLDQSAALCPGAHVYPQNDHSYCVEKGFCVGFSTRAWMDAQPLRTKAGPTSLDIYHNAQLHDFWEGTSYAGTSVRAAMKWLQDQGRIVEYRWASGAQDAADYVRTRGTLICGTDWLSDMFWPLAEHNYVLEVSGPLAGGHAYLVTWFNKRTRLFTIRNSWSASWGKLGNAYIRFDDLDKLIRDGGEAVSGIERKVI